MENSLKTLTSILAGFFAILFVGTTALTFALCSVEQSAFDAQLYVRALEEENIYQRLPDLIAQMLHVAAQNPDASIPLALLRNLSEDEWQMFTIELLPPKELKLLTDDTVRQIMAYINGENYEVILSLDSLKTHLSSPQGLNAIYGILKAQPDCTIEQLTAMVLGQQDMLLCNPPDTFLFFDLRPIIETEIKAAVVLVPQQATLISANSSQPQELQNLKNLRLVMRLSPLLPMFCLLMITVLAVRSLDGWLNWWGYPLLAAGFVSMSLSAISRPLAAVIFQVFISPVLPESSLPEFINIFKDLTASIVYNALQPMVIVAGVMALSGLIMIVFPFLVRILRKRSVETG